MSGGVLNFELHVSQCENFCLTGHNKFVSEKYTLLYVLLSRNEFNYIKTHDSESQGQEEAARTQRMSELFTGSSTLKLVNTLNKPPLKLSFSYQGLSTF